MRKLTTREWVLLICLAVIATVSGYVLFFHMPITQQMETLDAQIAQWEELEMQLDAKLAKMNGMEQELKRLEQQPDTLHRMPEYDNRQAVMVELNAILHQCQEYSIFFQEEQGEDQILRRRVTIPFTCDSYQQAKQILQRLHSSPLRSFLADLELSEQENGTIKATASMTFFEYHNAAAAEDTVPQQPQMPATE